MLNDLILPYDLLFNTVLIGAERAGKSSFLLRLTDEFYTESFISRIGMDFKIKRFSIEGKEVVLRLYDKPGDIRNRPMNIEKQLRHTKGIMLAVDISLPEQEIIETIRSCFSLFNRYLSTQQEESVIVIGTQSDKLPSQEQADRKLKQCLENAYPDRDILSIATSAKEWVNIEKAGLMLATRLTQQVKEAQETPKLKNYLCAELEKHQGELSAATEGFLSLFSSQDRKQDRRNRMYSVNELITQLNSLLGNVGIKRFEDCLNRTIQPRGAFVKTSSTKDLILKLIQHCKTEYKKIYEVTMPLAAHGISTPRAQERVSSYPTAAASGAPASAATTVHFAAAASESPQLASRRDFSQDRWVTTTPTRPVHGAFFQSEEERQIQEAIQLSLLDTQAAAEASPAPTPPPPTVPEGVRHQFLFSPIVPIVMVGGVPPSAPEESEIVPFPSK